MTRLIQPLWAITLFFGSPTKKPKNPRHTDGDHHNDDCGSNLVGVTIHNLSQGSTVLEQSDYSDESDRHHDMGTTELINAVALRLSLHDRYWPRGARHSDVDDDYIISR
jgi:hypothetical protein